MSTLPNEDESLVLCEDDSNQWSVGITRQTIERILKSGEPDPGDMIALWMFYAYTCRWQHQTRAKATTAFTAKGLGWSEPRVRKVKASLVALGLVQDVRDQDETTGQVQGWYIKVFHLAKRATLTISDRVENGTPSQTGRQMHKDSKGKCIKDSKEKPSAEALPYHSPEFEETWKAWEKHRKEKRQTLTPTSRAKQFKTLTQMGEKRAIAALENSIEKGYTGIFENGSTSPAGNGNGYKFRKPFDMSQATGV